MHFNIDKAYTEGLKLLEKHPGYGLQVSDICALRDMKQYDCIVNAFMLGFRQGYKMRKKHGGK